MKIAFVGFGEINTPREIIEQKCTKAKTEIVTLGFDVHYVGPVADDEDGAQVKEAKSTLKTLEFGTVVLCIAGWIPSHAVIDIIEPYKHLPVLLWGLTGWKENSRFITTADQAGTTALRPVLKRMGFRFRYLVNLYGGPSPLKEIKSFLDAASAIADLKGRRIGSMGYRDMKLFATLHDGISLRSAVGVDIDCFEMLEVYQTMELHDKADIEALCTWMLNHWRFIKQPQKTTLESTAKLYLSIKTKIKKCDYQGITLIDVDGVKKLLKFAPAGVFMLIDQFEKIPTIPENDITGAVTQLIVKKLTGQIGAYLEFYEFTPTGAIMGVPDYVPSEIVDGEITIMPTAFGHFGEGLLNVSKLKTGEITLARLGFENEKYVMHIVRATAKTPLSWEEAGWSPPAPQLPGLELIFESTDVNSFVQKVLGQHYIIMYGDFLQVLTDYCYLSGLEVWK